MQDKQTEKKYPLGTIFFYLTDRCNLRCRHCWIQPKYQGGERDDPALDLDLFKSIIEQAKPLGLSTVKLTGGEPLLHPQIHEILSFIRAQDLRLIVETNGILCSEEISRKIATCKNPYVSVSLDGTSYETHEWMRGVRGCFDATLEGIRNLVKAGFKPQIIMSVLRRNRDQMEHIVHLAEDLGCGSVKFNIVIPIARGKELEAEGELFSIEELLEIGRWVEQDLSASTDLRIVYSHPPAFRTLGKMFGESADGCQVCNIKGTLGVLARGSYALCGIGETVPDLIFGHAAVDRLEDMWDNNPMLLEIRKELPARLEGICSKCLFKARCLGCCIAMNYYRNKNLWASHWYCEEAWKRSLFPESREARTAF